ncbi:MAG: DUF1850 domain-containing protein [Deinococcota bacterium]
MNLELAQAQMLCVVQDLSAEVIVAVSLEPTPTWTVAWNHSVTGILVRDFYTFEADTMTLVKSHAPSFDAGLGHIPGRGRVVSDANHGYWILDINEAVADNQYLLRVGSESVNHRIIHEDMTYSLSDVAAGERVRVFVAENCLEPSTLD